MVGEKFVGWRQFDWESKSTHEGLSDIFLIEKGEKENEGLYDW